MNDHEALKILGVEKATSFLEVATAYKKLAVNLHPDRSKEKPSVAEAQFKHISRAFHYLEDKEKSGLLVLPIIKNERGVGQIPQELEKFLDPSLLTKLIDYLVTKTPKWMRPTLKQVCANFDPLVIINFVIKNGIKIPELFSGKRARPKKKPSKPARKSHIDEGFVAGTVLKEAIINESDCRKLNRLPLEERGALKVRCILRTVNITSGASREEHIELSLPEGLNPSGKISLDGRIWDITLSNEPWGGPPPVGIITNPKITHTTKHNITNAPNSGTGTVVQNLHNIASMSKNQAPPGAAKGPHTPSQKLGPGDGFWPPGKTFLN